MELYAEMGIGMVNGGFLFPDPHNNTQLLLNRPAYTGSKVFFGQLPAAWEFPETAKKALAWSLNHE
jgi:hypothetical protein